MSESVKSIAEVAIAVQNQDEVAALFEEILDIKFTEYWTLPEPDSVKVKSAWIGDTLLQLLESETPDAVIGKYVHDKGEGLHHIALKVTNLDTIIARLKARGAKLLYESPVEVKVTEKFPRQRAAFVHPKSTHGVLLELLEDIND